MLSHTNASSFTYVIMGLLGKLMLHGLMDPLQADLNKLLVGLILPLGQVRSA